MQNAKKQEHEFRKIQENINRDYEKKMRAVNDEASYKILKFEEEH